MNIPSLKDISDTEIFSRLKAFRRTENQVIADVVLHLNEVDRRGSYREAGYSSLFAYCREALEYSEGSSGRRVRAARALKNSPELYQMLREGKISLCAIAEVAPVLTEENRNEVLALTVGRSKREAGRLAVHFGAVQQPKRERIVPRRVQQQAVTPGLAAGSQRSITPPVERFGLHLEVSAECKEMLEEARNQTGAGKLSDVLEIVLKKYLKRDKKTPPQRKPQKKDLATETARIMTRSRYIPLGTRRAVRERDGHRCSYVSPDGKRCSEKRGLQIDHRHPYAVGGDHSIENLRMLCGTHNRFCAEDFYGKEFIEERRRNRSARDA